MLASLVEGSSAFGQGLSSFFCGEQKRFNNRDNEGTYGCWPFQRLFYGHPRTHSRNNAHGRDFTCCSPYATILSSVSYRPCFLSPDCITRPAVFIVGFDSGNSSVPDLSLSRCKTAERVRTSTVSTSTKWNTLLAGTYWLAAVGLSVVECFVLHW